MLSNVSKIEELKAEAIKIKNREKIIVHWPQFGKNQEQAFDLERDHCVSEHAYTVNNSVIAFYERGTLYVIPYFKKAMEILEQEEYAMNDMYVPFSNSEYPLLEKDHWQALQKEARSVLQDEFEAECIAFSKSVLNISPIEQETIDEKCMQVPEDGIEISNPQNGEIRRFPVLTGYCCDCFVMDYLGKYSVKDGIITFVNANGKQYVSKDQQVLDILIDSGYRFRMMPAILTNGEEPAQYDIAKIWNNL